MTAGHIHSHEFRNAKTEYYPDLDIPLMITPSVTPVFKNNPMYQTYEIAFDNRREEMRISNVKIHAF